MYPGVDFLYTRYQMLYKDTYKKGKKREVCYRDGNGAGNIARQVVPRRDMAGGGRASVCHKFMCCNDVQTENER